MQIPNDYYDFSSLSRDIREIKEHQEENKNNIREIKLKLLDPDAGVISRVKDLERVKVMWSRFFWIFAAAGVAVIISFFVTQ